MSDNIFEQEITSLEKAFNDFYCSYNSTKIMSYPDCLIIYGISFGYSTAVEKECNELIERLGLPLVAKKNARNGIFFDTVLITEKKKD